MSFTLKGRFVDNVRLKRGRRIYVRALKGGSSQLQGCTGWGCDSGATNTEDLEKVRRISEDGLLADREEKVKVKK